MRIAFISDIHGNGIGLRTVLESIEKRCIDIIVCLGDICCGGPEPSECLKLVRDYADFCVIGNTDSALLAYCNSDCSTKKPVDESVKWTAESLSEDDIRYLQSLPISAEIPTDSITFRAFHGTLSSNSGEYTPDDMFALSEKADNRIAYVSGHTHKPFISHLGRVSFLNPGSVGSTTIRRSDGSKANLPLACYMIVDIEEQFSAEFIQIEISADEFKCSLLRSNMPDRERLIKRW